MNWHIWPRRPRTDDAADRARYETAAAEAAQQKQRAQQLDGWTKRVKGVMS